MLPQWVLQWTDTVQRVNASPSWRAARSLVRMQADGFHIVGFDT